MVLRVGVLRRRVTSHLRVRLIPFDLHRSSPGDRDKLERSIAVKIAETIARIDSLGRSLDDIVRSSEGSPPDDEHDPDGATSGFERAQIASLLDSARNELKELEWARERLEVGTFGLCESCGRPITTERLRARPSVRTCVDCAA